MKRMTFALAFTAGLTVGCAMPGPAIQGAINNYQLGRYADAAAQLESLEASFPEMNAKGRVRYFVYRGLSLYKLGRGEQARSFLVQGKEAYERGEAKWLSPNIVEAMNKALAELNGQPPALATSASTAATSPASR